MDFKTIADWANSNEGLMTLAFALFSGIAGGSVWLYKRLRKARPSREERRSILKTEVAHAEALKKEVESHVEWRDIDFYGEMQIRDAAQVLPHSGEIHSSTESPYSIVTLVGIHNERLEFLTDLRGIVHIKQVAGFWHYADESDDDAIKVETIVWINYRNIECFRWETNGYWEWPQVCCRFAHPKTFPVSNVLYVQQVKGSQKPYFRTICRKADVTEMPPVLVKSR